MHQILLDASHWRNSDDFYAALLPALGAPEWHGNNLDALNDTIGGGDINQVNPPFAIQISGCSEIPPDLRAYLARFLDLIADLRLRGVPVDATCSNWSAPSCAP